jgi:transposase-like protein
MKKLVDKKVSQNQIKKIVSSDQSKSSKIKELFNLGLEVREISDLLEIRYNFSYNVISNYINTSEEKIEVVKKTSEVSKKDKIIELYKQKKSNKEISIELKTNYNYVFNTIKSYKQSLEETN